MANISHKIREVKPVFWFLLLAALVLLSAVLAITFNGNGAAVNIIPGGNAGNSSQSSTPKSQEYATKYDVSYLDNGELYLANYALTDKVKVTETQGQILEYLISKDKKNVIYTTTDREYVKSELQKLANLYPNLNVRTDSVIATKMFRYNVDAETAAEILSIDKFDWSTRFKGGDTSQLKIYDYFNSLYVTDYGIELHNFSETDLNQFVFSARGVWVMDLATNDKQKVTIGLDPRERSTNNPGLHSVDDVLFNKDFIAINYYDLGGFKQQYLFKRQGASWSNLPVSTVCDPSLSQEILFQCKVLYVNAEGKAALSEVKYQFTHSTGEIISNSITLVDTASGAKAGKVQLPLDKAFVKVLLGTDNQDNVYYYLELPNANKYRNGLEIFKSNPAGEVTSVTELVIPETSEFEVNEFNQISPDGKYLMLFTRIDPSDISKRISYLYEISTGKITKLSATNAGNYRISKLNSNLQFIR